MSDPDDNLFLFRFILKVAKDEDDDNIVNMADVKTIFKDLDNDGDGNVELDEFLVNKILMLLLLRKLLGQIFLNKAKSFLNNRENFRSFDFSSDCES